MFRIKIEDPALSYPVYGRKCETKLEVTLMKDMLIGSKLVSHGTLITMQEKVGWFKWVDLP